MLYDLVSITCFLSLSLYFDRSFHIGQMHCNLLKAVISFDRVDKI